MSNLTRPEAVRFLQRATFGASNTDIERLQELGSFDAWIADQIAQPVSRTLPYTLTHSNGSYRYPRHHIWWSNAITGSDQLRQRVAFALSEIFVVSDRDYVLGNQQYGVCQYYDMLAEHAFGNFADLLTEVTLHPVMGTYLGFVRNEPADPERNIRPDENFARELLQLFTIGLYELTPGGEVVESATGPVPAYSQRDVEEFARVFTGWNLHGSRYWDDSNPQGEPFLSPMEPWDDYHDRAPKSLLRGERTNGGQTAKQDLTTALANIAAHPNVGPFISTRLIQRLVTSNPSTGYVERIARVFDGDREGVRGNLGAVVTAILLDDEALTGGRRMPERFGKVKEPLMRLTQLWRAFNAQPGPDAEDERFRPYAAPTHFLDDVFGQGPLQSPSVFNFFQPTHSLAPESDLVAPEHQILSEIALAATNNLLFDAIEVDHQFADSSNRSSVAKIQLEDAIALASDPDALIGYLNVLLTGEALPSSYVEAITQHLKSIPPSETQELERCLDAIYAVVGSPYHLVQR